MHIQHNDERNFYALERLWKDCPTVPVDGIAAGSDVFEHTESEDVAVRGEAGEERE